MALQGAPSVSVAAGQVQSTVAGTFPATYQVGVETSWVTAIQISAKTAAGFTIDFATPTPVGGGSYSWVAGTPVSPDSGASQAIGAGLATLTITGTFGPDYQVSVGPRWVTDYEVVSRTGTSFVINFGTPAPAGGSTADWLAVVPQNTTSVVVPVTPYASASVTVAAGAVDLAVAPFGALPISYEVTVATDWVTTKDITSKTTAGFTIQFGTPAPAAGGTVLWIVYGPAVGQVSLADYLDELRDLLHDPNDRFWSAAQKAKYINRAIRQRDLDTGSNRQTFTFALTTGTALYTIGQVNGRIFDVISITLIFGQIRQILDNLSLTELTAQGYRYSQNFQGWTCGWARQGPSNIIFGPTPSQAFTTEWDCSIFSLPLLNLTDTDPLPFPLTKPVPFYAAYLAKINERKMGEAGEFLQDYTMELGTSVNSRAAMVPNAYSGIGRSWVRG